MFAAALALALVALRRFGFGPPRGAVALGGASALLAVGGALAPRTPPLPEPIRLAARAGYASSRACQSCHPAQYETFHDSFHRSMTEAAGPASVRAPWRGMLSWRDRQCELFRRGDEYWVRLPDPDRAAALARAGQSLDAVADVERRVVMTTGSHHYQAYWLQGARGNELWQLPFVYHFESERFIPRHDAFLQPEDDPPYFARWNSSCIQCHSVAGEPRHDLASDRFESRAVELGVACESCHGPGAEHVRREQSPWLRERQRGGDAASAIVNPARLGAERGSEVCGQCHSYFVPRDPERWWTSGFTESYLPGGDLDASRRVLDYGPGAPEHDPELSEALSSLFYADGTIRVGGREWNGLMRSACYGGHGERQLSCMSCHRLHGGSRDDQLGPGGESNDMCLGCHAGYAAGHSRHAAGTSGDQCVSCHMPRTTYALFKAIRSHRITRPRVDRDPGAPLNACNACHQNRSLDWTEGALVAWSDSARGLPAERATPSAPGAASEPSALALAALSGDAAARVIAVAALGDPAARAASGTGWQPQLLVEALDDPYAAVRFVAQRSLRSFQGFADLEFDFAAPRPARLAEQGLARQRALEIAARATLPSPPPLPHDGRGVFQPEVVAELRSRRDPRPIRIAE